MWILINASSKNSNMYKYFFLPLYILYLWDVELCFIISFYFRVVDRDILIMESEAILRRRKYDSPSKCFVVVFVEPWNVERWM